MKIGIFTGAIKIQMESKDVRKLYILERLKYLNQDEIWFEIITPKVEMYSFNKLNNAEYNTYKFINKKHLKMISTLIYSSNKLISSDCEMMHCYTYQAAMLAWIANYLRKQKYLIIFEPMGLAYEESKLNEKSSIKVRLIKNLIKLEEEFVFRRSDIITVYTNTLKSYISRKFSTPIEKIYVIPHGVELNAPYIMDKSKRSLLFEKLNIPEKNKTVMYAGSLSELHGTPFLMEAIYYLNRKREDISFLILGEGVLEYKLKDWVKENKLTNVHLLGFVPSEKIGYYFSLADILVIPHAKCMQTELDQPTKLFEYLASEKPVVSFNLKAIAEVVGNNAVLVEPDNPKALADGILTLVDNENLCRELGEKGKVIAKEYSWEISAKRQLDLYKELSKKIG